jgi:hypothetical protein
MYAPTPSFVQVNEYRRQDLLADAERSRFIRSSRRSGTVVPTATTKPRRAFSRAYVRYALTTLASITFAMSLN